jgi:hypothetical protein
VLIYVLLADPRVEIVADRGIDARVRAPAGSASSPDDDGHFGGNAVRSRGRSRASRAVMQLLETSLSRLERGRNRAGGPPIML